MASGDISDDQITVSSSHYSNQQWQGRLNNNNSYWWTENKTPSGDWIQVDLLNSTEVSGIITQGHPDVRQWVKKLQIQYGSSGDSLMYILPNNDPIVSIFACFPDMIKNHYCIFKILHKMLVVTYWGVSYQHN